MARYLIHPIVMGTKVFDKSMMTYQHGFGETYTIPIYGWYLEGGDKRILVDTGEMRPIQSEEREAAIGGKIHTIDSGLERFGLTPEDIDIVIHTHLHADHCENDYRCVNAEIYAHEKEMEAVHGWHPMDYRYVEDYIEDVEENGQLRTVAPLPGEELEIVPGVRVLHTPLHTEGGLTVLVDTPAGVAGITGFCVIMENFDPPQDVRAMEMEVIPPGTVIHPVKAYDAMLALRDRVDILIPVHEPRFATGAVVGAV